MIHLKKAFAALLSAALTCGAIQALQFTSEPFPAAVEAAGESYNPCNKQDDAEVHYDGSRWIQPPEWNCPTVNPRNYQGGIMLFFDKIGLEPEARGKVQRVYFSVHGETEAVSYIKFHVFYDTRLKIKENEKGEVMTAGKALPDFTTGSAMVEEGQLAFYAYSDQDIGLINGSLFTIDFIVPEHAEPGEIYPIGLSYVDDGIVSDMFINSARDDAGKLQMTYVFTRGIYNGYIKMMGEKKTTAATTITTAETTTATRETAPPEQAYLRGDLNHDGAVGVEDAQLALLEYVNAISGLESGLTEAQKRAGDVNGDGAVSVEDAQAILLYYVSNTLSGGNAAWEELLGGNAQAS